MYRYVIKRILMLIPVIIGVSFLVFVMLDLAPGNVVDFLGADMDEAQRQALEHSLGYDRSVLYRYGLYMKGLLSGDMGTSYIYHAPVWQLYLQRLPHTLKLAFASVLVSVVLSIPLGIGAAVHRGTLSDNAGMVVSLLGLSIPNFWLGLMLMVLFSLKLGWLPSGGDTEGLRSLILPAFTVGTGLMATLTRTTRSTMVDVLEQEYLRLARSKGVTERKVVYRHALRNALIPILNVIGSQLGHALGGATVTENVFSIPGVGNLLIDAIKQRDTVTACGCLIMTVTLISVIQLAVDILYAFADPRLKAQYALHRKRKEREKDMQ